MNIGNCDNANTEKVFEIAEGEKLECPVCHKEILIEVKGTPWLKISIIAAIVVILAGVGLGIYFLNGKGPEIDKIKLEPENLTLVEGQKDVIKATVMDKDGKEIKDMKVTFNWTIEDEKVASVTQGGEVAALKTGRTSITVKIEGDDKHNASCQIDVKPQKVLIQEGKDTAPSTVLITNLSVASSKISLKKGEQTEIKMTVEPSNHTENISIESSDPKVAFVEEGIIKAKKEGDAQILIKTDKSGKSAIINVTVKSNTGGGNTGGGNTGGGYTGGGSKNLGYATFKGAWPNDVHGRMIFKTSHVIDSKDPKGRVAEPGDYVIGEWSDGHLVQGVWYGSDNQVKGSIIIGK